MRLLPFVFLVLLAEPLHAASPAIVGEWLTEPGQFQEQDSLLIGYQGNNKYDVDIHAVFCPLNNECMNARFGDISFTASLDSNTLMYKVEACRVKVTFAESQATVSVMGCNDNFPYGGPRGPFRKQKSH